MTSNAYQDDCLILTGIERRKLSTKVHRRQKDGTWSTQGHSKAFKFSAERHTFSSLREMMGVLQRVSRNPVNLLVGEEINPLANPRDLARRIKDEGGVVPGLVAHPRGHHWIMWDVDGASASADWFDPTSKDRSRDGDFVRGWIKQNLPPQFHDKDCILQWSSGALFTGKISLHIWQWLGRPVARESIYEYFKDRAEYKGIIDVGIWQNARVHYIADPIFKHIDGSTMDDPLAGVRWQWIPGALGEACEALPEWVDKPTWDAAKAAKEAATAAAVEAQLARRAAVLAATAASYALQQQRDAAKGKKTPAFDGRVAADSESARGLLESYKTQITELTAHDSKHEALLSTALKAAINLGATLDEGEIRDALESVASAALQKHGTRSRDKAEADKEAASIFASAFLKARAKGFRQPKVPAFAAVGAAACATPRPKKPSTAPPLPSTPLTADAIAATSDESNPPPSPIALDAPTASLDPSQCTPHNDPDPDLDDEANIFASRFIAARSELAHLITTTVTAGGRHAVKAPAGLGKSHAICEALITHRRSRRLTSRSPVHIAVPDLKLARELREDLRRRGAHAVLAVTRNERNCEKFAEVIAAGRLTPDGGQRWCESCQWHPKNAGSPDACPFWRAYSAQDAADFVCESHALEALKTSIHSTPLDADAPLPVHIDWASFSELELGDTATPWVRRTDAGLTISAKVSYRLGEGTSPPIPRYEDTPRWKSASKASLIKFIASAYGCEANRACVAEAATRGITVNAFIDWTCIGKLSRSTALYRPTAYYENKGFLQGWHIGVERVSAANGGKPLPEIEFTGTFPLTRESKAEIRAWVRGMWGVDSDLALDDYAREHIDEWPVDALVIDESIQHTLRYGGTLTRGQITDLRLAEEIAGGGVDALLALMWKSEENKSKRDPYRAAHYFNSDVLAQAVHDLDRDLET